MAIKRKVAHFFYSGANLTGTQVATVEKYFTAGGYNDVFFRKNLGANAPIDIIEDTWDIISGDVPAIYPARFGTDKTKIIDTTATADILDGKATTPPTASPATTPAKSSDSTDTGALKPSDAGNTGGTGDTGATGGTGSTGGASADVKAP